MRILLICLMYLVTNNLHAQELDADLLAIQSRLDSIVAYTADVELTVDISFINMPPKSARIALEEGKEPSFQSDDFALLPKRGIDFSMRELFKYPFITVYRGEELLNGYSCKVVNVIPTTKKSDFSIATLYLDTQKRQIAQAEINTKKEGSFLIDMFYDSPKAALPERVVVSFEVERLSIPINFMGKDTSIDRKQLREEGPKTGKIFLQLSNYSIQTK